VQGIYQKRVQAYNFKRKQQQMKLTSTSSSITHGDTPDYMLYVVMEQYKYAEKMISL